MEFVLSVFFLMFYYVRPQDWVPGLAGANLVKPIMGVWLLVLLSYRSGKSPLPGILRTPHDWVMLAYFGYVVFTAPDFSAAFTGFLPGVMFYALTVQSVTTWPRLLSYLKWWNGALVAVALFGVLALHGIDFTGARDNSNTQLGRLALGTWLHNNPNALGHSVVVIIPLSYVLYFWRGTASGRVFLFPLLAAIAYYCAWQTGSKGAFVVGGMLVVLIFVIGRPKMVQVFALAMALTLGVSALSFLPRMSEMGNLRADEGVQGRLMAWEMALQTARTEPTGLGWKQFIAYIPWKEGRQYLILKKATHSSYVQIGADLGRYGMFLYLAAIWCALHTLITVKPRDNLEERCRRAAFLILAGYAFSGWMINREYHTEYFLLIAVSAAFHRLAKGRESGEAIRQPSAEAGPPGSELAGAGGVSSGEPVRPAPGFIPAFTSLAGPVRERLRTLWNRFGLVDLTACLSLTWLTFRTWEYLLENI